MAVSNGNYPDKDSFDLFSKLTKTESAFPKVVLNEFMSAITGNINYEAEQKIIKNT